MEGVDVLIDYEEKTIVKETLYAGKVLQLDLETVALPNGKEATREIVRHPGAVAIVAMTDDRRVLLVRQYRKATEQVLLELPAGKLEPGEDPTDAAGRELKEETGYQADRLSYIHSFFTSPGFADEQIVMYAATNLSKGTPTPDDDEFLDVIEATREEVEHWLSDESIKDAKTFVGLYWWLRKGYECE